MVLVCFVSLLVGWLGWLGWLGCLGWMVVGRCSLFIVGSRLGAFDLYCGWMVGLLVGCVLCVGGWVVVLVVLVVVVVAFAVPTWLVYVAPPRSSPTTPLKCSFAACS